MKNVAKDSSRAHCIALNALRAQLEDKDVIKKLEKTRVEKKVDLAKAVCDAMGCMMRWDAVQEKEQRDNEERARRRKIIEDCVKSRTIARELYNTL